ncbi:hypothetical protein [Dickeya chrysanthemi]|uniref:Uncharacterized protein n=1 Tax=Dickeya chrysanthemi TaxID=556 RepID=A0ABU8JK55_DICCH|nr:hypothetical protein [Dickeya chrysanthemi]MBX9446725.1 hypothetical protein [Dickeya chrysanthemi]MCA7007355.1 hypothetical protein [Dickeya chrysanthemi]
MSLRPLERHLAGAVTDTLPGIVPKPKPLSKIGFWDNRKEKMAQSAT